jgi:predicted ATPase
MIFGGGNNDTDGSLQDQNRRKKTSTSTSNNFVMRAVSVEPLKTRGVPGPVCDLISNMLNSAGGNDRLGGEDVYRDMSDVRDDLQLMLDKPSIYLYDQDMGRFATTGLQFGGTLYGRKAELSTIIDSYRRSAVGESTSVVISGKSGTGKSLLAAEVGKYVSSNGGILLSGKFDQLQQGKPFSALASAFDQFCDFLLRNRGLDSEKQKMSRQLHCVFGRDVYYLTKLMPKLATILCLNVYNSSDYDENCVNAQKRLQWLLCEFVQVISTSFAAPVTLFLDDFQWADPASIAAVNHLSLTVSVTSQDAHFFFLGCFREGETDGKVSCDDIDSSIQVKLDCMGKETLNTMVSETLCLSPRLTRALTSAIYHKTKGNPLFVTRLMLSLYKDGLLRPSLRRRRWEWDKEKILSQKLSDDVAEFLSHTIEALPDDVKATLRTLSCFGASVSCSFVKTLERALGKSLLDSMDVAVTEGLLDKIDDQYRFSHDRIQEAAYKLMKFVDRCEFHFSYGMALASLEDEEGEDDFLFTAVTQLNLAGPEAVEDEGQYVMVAKHNLRAGKKAMEMSDFEAAHSYFDHGITFLRKNHWEEHYELSLELFNLAAKCALSNGDSVSLNLLSEQVMRKARSFEDKLNILYCMTCVMAYSSKLPESIEKGLDILSQLGIELRGRDSSVEVCVKETRDLLSSYTHDDLLNIRRMTDPTMIMAMKFLSKLMVGMIQIMPKSAPHVVQQIIQLSLSHGMSPASPLGFVHFGSYAANLGDISEGYRYVKLARSLLDKLGSKEWAGEVICFSTQVASYIEPLQATLEYHDEGYAAAMAAGDIIQAAVNMYTGYVSFFYAGVKLQTTRKKGDDAIKFMRERKIRSFLIPIKCMQNSVLRLVGMDEEPCFSAEEEKILATSNNAKAGNYMQQVYISFIFRLYDETKDYTEKILDCIAKSNWANLMFAHSFRSFYSGLASFWIARSSSDREQWYERGSKSKLAFRKWAETCRWNFEHKWYLLEAEEAFCDGRYDDAKAYYEKAVTSAKDHKVR